MGLFTMHPLIGLAERAELLFNAFDKAIGKPFLTATRMAANRAELADTGKSEITHSMTVLVHGCYPTDWMASARRSRPHTVTVGSIPQGSKTASLERLTQAAFIPADMAPITSNGLLETSQA